MKHARRLPAPPRATSPEAAAGFTLLEMLVVLVLAALIGGILLQGMQHSFSLQQRFGAEIFRVQQGAMRADWFRQSIEGLMPDHDDGRRKFKGEIARMSGLTTMPVVGASGAITAVSWRLTFDPARGETRLRLGDAEDAPAVLAWPGDSGRFVYLDDKGGRHDAWPPFLGRWPQLPEAVILEYTADGEARSVVAVPKGPRAPFQRRTDIEKI